MIPQITVWLIWAEVIHLCFVAWSGLLLEICDQIQRRIKKNYNICHVLLKMRCLSQQYFDYFIWALPRERKVFICRDTYSYVYCMNVHTEVVQLRFEFFLDIIVLISIFCVQCDTWLVGVNESLRMETGMYFLHDI